MGRPVYRERHVVMKAACQLSDLGAINDRDWTISSSRHRDELTGGE